MSKNGETLKSRVLELLAEDIEYREDWIKNHYRALEKLRGDVLLWRCRLQRELYEERERLRMPNYPPDRKDKDTPRYTDLDRRVMLEASVAVKNEQYEVARGLEELIRERVKAVNDKY